MITQQWHTVVSPVFEPSIWLHTHKVQFFTGMTTHSITELTPVHFQDWQPYSQKTIVV